MVSSFCGPGLDFCPDTAVEVWPYLFFDIPTTYQMVSFQARELKSHSACHGRSLWVGNGARTAHAREDLQNRSEPIFVATRLRHAHPGRPYRCPAVDVDHVSRNFGCTLDQNGTSRTPYLVSFTDSLLSRRIRTATGEITVPFITRWSFLERGMKLVCTACYLPP